MFSLKKILNFALKSVYSSPSASKNKVLIVGKVIKEVMKSTKLNISFELLLSGSILLRMYERRVTKRVLKTISE